MKNELYEVLVNTDQTEGRGPMKAVCYAVNQKVALEIVNHPYFYKHFGVQGTGPYGEGKHDVRPALKDFPKYKDVYSALKGLFNLSDQSIDEIKNMDLTAERQKQIEILNKKKEAALKKLTDEEQFILGLK